MLSLYEGRASALPSDQRKHPSYASDLLRNRVWQLFLSRAPKRKQIVMANPIRCLFLQLVPRGNADSGSRGGGDRLLTKNIQGPKSKYLWRTTSIVGTRNKVVATSQGLFQAMDLSNDSVEAPRTLVRSFSMDRSLLPGMTLRKVNRYPIHAAYVKDDSLLAHSALRLALPWSPPTSDEDRDQGIEKVLGRHPNLCRTRFQFSSLMQVAKHWTAKNQLEIGSCPTVERTARPLGQERSRLQWWRFARRDSLTS